MEAHICWGSGWRAMPSHRLTRILGGYTISSSHRTRPGRVVMGNFGFGGVTRTSWYGARYR